MSIKASLKIGIPLFLVLFYLFLVPYFYLKSKNYPILIIQLLYTNFLKKKNQLNQFKVTKEFFFYFYIKIQNFVTVSKLIIKIPKWRFIKIKAKIKLHSNMKKTLIKPKIGQKRTQKYK